MTQNAQATKEPAPGIKEKTPRGAEGPGGLERTDRYQGTADLRGKRRRPLMRSLANCPCATPLR